jgi:hypothetical protein
MINLFYFKSSNESDSDSYYINNNSNRSYTSARVANCSLHVYRQILPTCIPENEPLSFRNDESNDHDDASTNNTSNFLFSSPKRQSSNISQTIKQQPRIYPKTISRLLASSPAHQNQYRLYRGIGQTITSTTVSSSGSPCLSPIRYSFDTSQINEKSTNIDENMIAIPTDDIQTNQISLPNDDSSLKVSRIEKKRRLSLVGYSIIVNFSCTKLFK